MRAIDPALDFRQAWASHKDRCVELISEHGVRSMCEVGGGRDPLLAPDEVSDLEIDYTVLDRSQRELDLSPPEYRKVCGDICRPGIAGSMPKFDMVVSKMVAEHVTSGARMHENIHEMLNPGGIAFHFFPTLWYPPFVLNRVLPDALTRWALERGAPRDQPKFPVRYSRCRGPTPRMRSFFAEMGYEVLEYRPFYGTLYFDRIPVLGRIDRALSSWAARRRINLLTSFVFLVLRRPLSPAA